MNSILYIYKKQNKKRHTYSHPLTGFFIIDRQHTINGEKLRRGILFR